MKDESFRAEVVGEERCGQESREGLQPSKITEAECFVYDFSDFCRQHRRITNNEIGPRVLAILFLSSLLTPQSTENLKTMRIFFSH